MSLLYFARHGETLWNREGRYQGQLESGLTDRGYAQGRALAGDLAQARPDRVISSPLARCVETARPLADALGLELEIEPRLIEIDHGSWEGRLRSQIELEDPLTMRAWRQSPERVRFAGGESLSDVASRLRAFAGTLNGEQNVVAVTHDVLVRLAILNAMDRPIDGLWGPRVVNGGYARIAVLGGAWQLIEECCADHLQGLVSDTTRQAL